MLDNKSRIFVAGAYGFIGYNLTNKLLKEGYKVNGNRFTNKLHCLLVFEPRVPPKIISPRTSTTVARSKMDQVQGLPVTVCPNWLDRPASFISSVFSESSGPIRRKTGVEYL